jgi:hypothetical protein
MQNHLIVKKFYPDYRLLRREFEENFNNPKSTHPKRFVWDFWLDPDHYHLIRTPAYHYFNKKNYEKFHSYLVQWGREYLGCHDISPPWLSYYVDGCYQNLHSDVPHGPWAFVFSLTPNSKKFSGGETLLLKNKTLSYWENFENSQSYHYENFVERIPSLMNQLIVFDPRIPHGVTEVKGTRDPLAARLVIHGWFVNPRPYVTGGLSTTAVHSSLQQQFNFLNRHLAQIGLLNGALSIRMKINRQGQVLNYRVLTDTLVSVSQNPDDVRYLKKNLQQLFKNCVFKPARSESYITIPLIFK